MTAKITICSASVPEHITSISSHLVCKSPAASGCCACERDFRQTCTTQIGVMYARNPYLETFTSCPEFFCGSWFSREVCLTRVVSLGTASSQGPLIFALNFSMWRSHQGHKNNRHACKTRYTTASCHAKFSSNVHVARSASATMAVKSLFDRCLMCWHVNGSKTKAVREKRIWANCTDPPCELVGQGDTLHAKHCLQFTRQLSPETYHFLRRSKPRGHQERCSYCCHHGQAASELVRNTYFEEVVMHVQVHS
jgi:hypothetical protein